MTEKAGEGTDIVKSSATFALSANVENLTLTGTAAINGTGNELANVLTGNAASNSLDGGAGNDTLNGGDGDDTLTGGAGNDVLNGGAGNNTYVFSKGFGSDTVNSYAATGPNTDQVSFINVASTEVVASKNGLDAILTVGTNQITFPNYFDHSRDAYKVASFHFSDGVTWSDVPVNEPPAGTDKTVTTLEDKAYAIRVADFGFSDADGNSLSAVKITSLPAAGTLKLGGVAVTAGQSVSAAGTSPPASWCSPPRPTPTARATPASPSRCRTTAARPTAGPTSTQRRTRSPSTSRPCATTST